MSQALDNLYQFERNLRSSLENEDWRDVAELDVQCRDLVNCAIDEMSRLQDHEAQQQYGQALQQLADLYQLVQTRCRSARDAVAADLHKTQRGRQASQAYRLIDM